VEQPTFELSHGFKCQFHEEVMGKNSL
jgi:hypothetical protein